MKNSKLAARWAAIVGMFAGVACSGEGGGEPFAEANRPITQAEKIDYVLTRLGFDPSAAVVEQEYSVVQEDIIVWHEDLDAYLDFFETAPKAYMPNVGTPGADGLPNALDLSIGYVIHNVSSIKLVIEPEVTPMWALAFRRAAAEWSSAYVDGVGTKVMIDASNKFQNSNWTITIRARTTGTAAIASFPSPGLLNFLGPGRLILVNIFEEAPGQQNRFDWIALHEIGHTLGFQHPTAGPRVPGTRAWTHSTNPRCTDVGQAGTYDTVMCLGENGRRFLAGDDVRGAQVLYPDPNPFDLNAWSSQHCAEPCGAGEGHCSSNAQCAGFLVCLNQFLSRDLYGAPTGGRVCGPSSLVRGESGAGSCPTTASTARCNSVDCPCGVGMGDCDNDQECSTGLVCGENNGPGVGLGITYDICVTPRPPGCAVMDKDNIDGEFCSTTCPCSIGEGDCDNDSECLGDLVCGQNVGAAFDLPADLDFCVRPEVEDDL